MRARKVNEVQNFERGQDPKKALGIGGLDLQSKFEEFIEDLEMNISMSKLTQDEAWEDFLQKNLVGKTITADLDPLMTIKKSGKSIPKKPRGEYTIKIKDVKASNELSKSLERFSGEHNIIVADTENNMYSMKKGKIYFENES